MEDTIHSAAPAADQPWSTGEVDIKVHSLQHDFDIHSLSQLHCFLADCSRPDRAVNKYLLLIEDISPEVIRELRENLDIQNDVFEHHMMERLNGDSTQQVGNFLHAEKLSSTLLGRVSTKRDNYSLTWWRLLTHSLVGYTYEKEALTESDADATKIVVPHFSVHISSTSGAGQERCHGATSAVEEDSGKGRGA